MEKTAIILIVITLFILVIIVGLLSVLIFKLLKQGPRIVKPEDQDTGEALHPDISKSEFHPDMVKRIKEMERIKPKRTDIFCVNHSEEPGEVTCAICDELFCKACIKPFKSLHFCREHLPLIMRHEWQEVLTVKTSTQDPEQGVNLYQAKKQLFKSKDVPSYIETHYKINVDQDYIETYLVVYAMAESTEIVKEFLSPPS
jgi:hypothetical protein